MISPRVRAFLDEEHVRYLVLPKAAAAPPASDPESLADSNWHMAKVFLIHDPESGFLQAVLPASCRLDLERLRRVTDRPGLELASLAETIRLFPDCVPDALPPFGQLYGLPVYVDSCFPHVGELVFRAGSLREVVRLPYPVYETLARPVVADFCSH